MNSGLIVARGRWDSTRLILAGPPFGPSRFSHFHIEPGRKKGAINFGERLRTIPTVPVEPCLSGRILSLNIDASPCNGSNTGHVHRLEHRTTAPRLNACSPYPPPLEKYTTLPDGGGRARTVTQGEAHPHVARYVRPSHVGCRNRAKGRHPPPRVYHA